MSTEKSDASEKKPSSKSDCDRFQEKAKGVNKVILLWIAALLIAYFSGLEKVRRDVSSNANALQRNNLERQRLENEIKSGHAKFAGALREAHDYEDRHLNNFRKQLEEAKASKNKKKADDLEKLIPEIESRTTLLTRLPDNRKPKAIAEAEEEVYSRRRYEENKKFVETYRSSSQGREKQNQENRAVLIDQQQKLKAQLNGVAFDILSIKFEAPPLYAPIIWSLFLIGLIFFLMKQRATLLALCAKVLKAPDQPATPTPAAATEGAITEAPVWLAPLPYLDSPAKGGAPQKSDADAPSHIDQLHSLLGWQSFHQIAMLLAVAGLLVLVLLQMRVVWLELEISGHLGSQRERAIFSVIMTGLVFATFVAIWLWLRMKYIPEPDPPPAAHSRLATWQVVVLLIIPVALLLLLAVLLMHARWGIRYEHFLKSALLPLSVLAAAQFLVFCTFRLLRPAADSTAERAVAGTKHFSRREFLFWALPVALFGIFAVAKASAKKVPRQRLRPNGHKRSYDRKRHRGKRKHVDVELPQGFYLNPTSKVIHYVSAGHRIANAADSLKQACLKPYPGLFLPTQTQSVAQSAECDAADKAVQKPQQAIGSKAPPARPAAKAAQVVRSVPIAAGPQDRHVLHVLSGSATPILLSTKSFKPEGKRQLDEPDTEWSTRPRVNLATASHAFEQAALTLLRSADSDHKTYGSACECLIYAINHDLYVKTQTGQLPSFRLYDLLAGLAIRSNRNDYFKEMLRLISDFDQQDVFQSRIKKWQDDDGAWYKHWHNRKRGIKWDRASLK
jgi:hypothetical protein